MRGRKRRGINGRRMRETLPSRAEQTPKTCRIHKDLDTIARYNSRFTIQLKATQWKRSRSIRLRTRCPISETERHSCGGIFDFEAKRERLEVVTRELENP